jgi:hypothetical protein
MFLTGLEIVQQDNGAVPGALPKDKKMLEKPLVMIPKKHEDDNVHEAEIASKEKCEAVEEANVDSDEEDKSESESNGGVKEYLSEQEKMILRRLTLLIVSYAELVKRKPTQQKI